MKPFRRAVSAALALLVLTAVKAPAQEDARVLPRGYVALRVGGEFATFDSRLTSDGEVGLGAPFAAPFPASFFPPLAPARDSLARFFAATAEAGESFLLTEADIFPGVLAVDLAADLRSVPITVEVGVMRRLTLRATVPIVRTETELIALQLVDGAIGVNVARDSLTSRLARIDPSLAGIGQTPFVPLAGSRAGNELQRRYTRATGDETPLPLPTRGLGPVQLDELLEASLFSPLGIRSSPGSYRLGDAEIAAKAQLLGGTTEELSPHETGMRVAVEGTVRLPTATGAEPDSLAKLVTDLGHAGLSGALFADVPLGSRFWVNANARAGILFSRDVERLTWNPVEPWTGLGDTVIVRRDPGARLAASVAPALRITDQLALSARYGFATVGEIRYDAEPGPGSAVLAFVGLESTEAQTLQTLGLGLTYSTMSAYLERKTNIPLEVWLTYDTAIAGTGGAPDIGVVRVAGRIFLPAWGGR